MKSQEIARRWTAFFESRGHRVVPSASLVSPDPSLLFTVAGMVPFIPYFLGEQTPPSPRVVSVQKCIRTADIEEVGKTVRHGTFFQMCGNFSFGDYFKETAIPMAWELLTSSVEDGGFGLDPERLWVTVYREDDEAERIWREDVGVRPERIQRMGKDDNYWNTGQPGPGGPCSEIFYDRGPAYGVDGGPAADDTRYIEIWNLVFMQYRLSAVRSKDDFDIAGELEHKNIDTGLGLERLAMILQGVENMYETDQVRPVLDRAAQLAGRSYTSTEDPADPHYDDDVRLRMVADHVRSALMLISDGVRPGKITQRDVLVDYAAFLRGLVDLSGCRPLRVTVDAGNGMGGLTVPAVLGTDSGLPGLPLTIDPMYFELDGTFPNHHPDPAHPETCRT